RISGHFPRVPREGVKRTPRTTEPMMSMIETLEGRALLSASPTAQLTIQNSAAVVAARQALGDHQAALDQGVQDARAKIQAHRQALQAAAASGKAAVVAYKASAMADKGNPDALAA